MIFQMTYIILRFILVLVFSLAEKYYDELVGEPGYVFIRVVSRILFI